MNWGTRPWTIILPLALAVLLFFGGWWVNGNRWEAKSLRATQSAADARAAKLEQSIASASAALAAATASLSVASETYEKAHSDLDAYRNSLGSRYAGVRLCREPTAPGGGGSGPGATGDSSGASGPGPGGAIPLEIGPALGAFAADAEELRQRAILCKSYAEAVNKWAQALRK